ncbi:MAG: 30S ribosome-binding factor RbfA [Actinobacteria bacterium]|nr:30S ribosome-binding factor RbfA [Actinomycetota bacterium]
MRRVDEAVRAVLADAIPRNVKDPRVGFVTITDVTTSPDLRYAQVYVSVLGDETEQAGALDGLTSAHGILQREVGRQLHMKRTPTLHFHLDDTVARAARLEALIEVIGPLEDLPEDELS